MINNKKQYLSEEFIAKIDRFNLRARLIVEGFITGLHKSPYHGFSVEFSDHRQYNPGDAVGLLTYTNKITNFIPPKSMRSYLNVIFKELYNLKPAETTQIVGILLQIPSTSPLLYSISRRLEDEVA